jgi:hypothetical protein
MDEKIRVLISREVSNLDDDVDIDSIREELNSYVKMLKPRINVQDLIEWKLLFNLILQHTDSAGVAKRVARFPSDKEFAIYMSIPIPDDNQIGYGLAKVKNEFLKKKNEKYSHLISSNFDCYDSLYDYILGTGKYMINWIFSRGFVCGGEKIKFQS